MNKDITILMIFLALCFVGYLIFRYIPFRESMENNTSGSTTSGVAGDAANYASSIKTNSVKLHDILHIDKYRTDYENVVINLDDLVDNLMLQAALNIDVENPVSGLENLTKLNSAKTALNNVMKFIDGK
jgi:hypothetical protein